MKNIPASSRNDPSPVFNADLCTLCGICAEVCPEHVILLTSETIRIKVLEGCTYCGTCEEVCPQEAVALEFEIH